MGKIVRPRLSVLTWVLLVAIIVNLIIIHWSLKDEHNLTQMMVMDELMDLRTNISKLRGEILKLRLELIKHDTKPEWWEGSKHAAD